METTDYFTEIASKVHKKRRISEYSSEELEIYRRGKADALRQILLDEGFALTFLGLRDRFTKAIKFIDGVLNKSKSSTRPFKERDVSIFEDKYKFEPEELANLVFLQISDYRMRLEKARKIHAINSKLLADAIQLTIE